MEDDSFFPCRVRQTTDHGLALLEFLFTHHPRLDGGADALHSAVELRSECRALAGIHSAHDDEDVVIAVGLGITSRTGSEKNQTPDGAPVCREDVIFHPLEN